MEKPITFNMKVLQTQNTLVMIQPTMKAELLAGVESFQGTVQTFYTDYDTRYKQPSKTHIVTKPNIC